MEWTLRPCGWQVLEDLTILFAGFLQALLWKKMTENLQSYSAEPSSAAASRTATCSSSHCGKCAFALCSKKALHPQREKNQTFNLSSGFIFHVKGRRTSGEMNVKPRPKKDFRQGEDPGTLGKWAAGTSTSASLIKSPPWQCLAKVFPGVCTQSSISKWKNTATNWTNPRAGISITDSYIWVITSATSVGKTMYDYG